MAVRWHGPELLRPVQEKDHSVFSRIDALSIKEYPLPKSTRSLPALRRLEISSHMRKLDDDDLQQLSQLDQLQELVFLGFATSGPPLKHLPANLRKLTLPKNTPLLNNKELQELQNERPALEIYATVAGQEKRIELH